MPRSSRTRQHDPESGRTRRGGGRTSPEEPMWRRELGWKKFLDPRHPVTRLWFGLFLSCFPIFGPVVVLAGSYYFGCTRGKGVWIGIGLAGFLGGMAALQWFVLLDLKITSDLRLVWPEYAEEEGGLPKVWFIGWVCIMGMISLVWVYVSYRHRGPEFRSDGEHSIELQDQRRLRSDEGNRPLPSDDGAYAARQARGAEHATSGSELESEEQQPILPRARSISRQSSGRRSSNSVRTPDRIHRPEGPNSPDFSQESSDELPPRAPIPTTHVRHFNRA